MSNISMIRVVLNEGNKDSWKEFKPGDFVNLNGNHTLIDNVKLGDMMGSDKVTNIARFE